MNTMHQRHRSFQLLMPIFSKKWRHFVAVNVFANHVYNLIKWGKSSQNAVKQKIEDSACWIAEIAGISFMSPRYVMRKNLRRTFSRPEVQARVARGCLACEQAFGRAGNSLSLLFFSPDREPVHRLGDALRYKNSHFQNEGKCKISLV